MPLPENIENFRRQFRATTTASQTPLPEFPPVFDALKRRLPEIADELEQVQKSLAEWVKSLQAIR